jgi:hypothetical protein
MAWLKLALLGCATITKIFILLKSLLSSRRRTRQTRHDGLCHLSE